MATNLIYQMFAKLLSWMVLRTRSDPAKEIEILVLRHQLAVLLQRRYQLPTPVGAMFVGPCVSLAKIDLIIRFGRCHAPWRSEAKPHW